MQNLVARVKIANRISGDEQCGWTEKAPQYFLDRYDSLLAECEKAGEWTMLDRFMRFITATYAMHYFAYTRELTQMHAWLVRSLNDKYIGDASEEVTIDLPYRFIDDVVISGSQYFDKVMVKWLGAVYYYCAEQSALDDFGVTYLELAIRACSLGGGANFNLDRVFLFSRLMTWTVQTSNPMADMLTRLCEAMVADVTVPVQSRARLAFTLTTRSGRLSKITQPDWAKFTLANFKGVLTSQEKLAVLATQWSGIDEMIGSEILSEIRNMRSEMLIDTVSRLATRVLEDGRGEIIKPVISIALTGGNFEFVNSATAAWYGVDQDHSVVGERVLWQVPLYQSGYIGLVGTTNISLSRDSDICHAAIVGAENRFKGSSITVRGVPSAEMHIPERMGHPSHEFANEFESTLINAYLPYEVLNWLRENEKKISSQVVVPSSSHPIQGIQIKVLGTTWPLVASFMPPLPDAVVSKVAIWSSGGLLFPNHEIDVLSAIFSKANIVVDVYIAEGEHGKKFAEIYGDTSYQIIWLIGHGEYDCFAPKDAKLEVGAGGIYVGMEELLHVDLKLSVRRLLMLNVCDGASHPGNGVLPRLGFAASLATPWQATISHQWPVAPLSAAVLGGLLACHIREGKSFFEAYKGMILDMLGANDLRKLANRINDAAGSETELANRLLHSSQSLTDFEHYASATFFE